MDAIISQGANALVIVAHPDDETIWCGGLILANPQAKWTILCLSRASDTDRAPKFARVAARLGARGIIADWDDEGRLGMVSAVRAAKRIILDQLKSEHFDFLFTHAANGEYGHERHKAAHQAVGELLASRRLSAGASFCFNYKKQSKYKLVAASGSDLLFKLSPKLFKEKRSIVSELYGFDPQGIDIGYCTNPEAFRLFKM